jgi:hypothetical protein
MCSRSSSRQTWREVARGGVLATGAQPAVDGDIGKSITPCRSYPSALASELGESHSCHVVLVYLPFVVLFVPFWAGLLSGSGVLGLGHVLMLPCMVVAMLHRRDEYAQDHRRAQSSNLL